MLRTGVAGFGVLTLFEVTELRELSDVSLHTLRTAKL
jgi:hypothetical protein